MREKCAQNYFYYYYVKFNDSIFVDNFSSTVFFCIICIIQKHCHNQPIIKMNTVGASKYISKVCHLANPKKIPCTRKASIEDIEFHSITARIFNYVRSLHLICNLNRKIILQLFVTLLKNINT